MKKIIIKTILVATIFTNFNLQATDKSFGYDVINACRSKINDGAPKSSLFSGLLSGLGQAYVNTIRRNGIDNDFASLTPGDFATEMCKNALNYRKKENEKTGGKYDVTNFYYDLIDVGYYMTLPPRAEKDKNTTKEQ